MSQLVSRHFNLYRARQGVVHFVVLGDSIAAGVPGGADDGHACALSTARVIQDNGTTRSVGALAKADAYVGGWSGWTYLAQEFYDLTGLASIWTFVHKSSMAIAYESAPTRHLDFGHPGPSDGNFFWDSVEDYDRSVMFATVQDIIANSPGLNVTARHLIWWAGATDAAALHNATATQADIVGAYEDTLAYWQANYGATNLYIMGSGEIGVNEAAADADQAGTRDMAGVRAAQVTAASSAGIYTAFEQNPLRSGTYGTFTQDANGRWTAGQEHQVDGTHNSEAFTKAACKRAALNIAAQLGLIT